MKLYGVIGVGGFGREVMPLARQSTTSHGAHGEFEFVFVVEPGFAGAGQTVNGHRVLSLEDFLTANASERYFNIAISNSRARQRIAECVPPDLARPFGIVAPTHISLDCNDVGDGPILCNFTHITSNAKIGKFFHANMYSCVEHDCVIGDYVTFSPGVKCSGRVVIEDHVFVGAGAVIRDATDKPIVLGRGAVIGMGAVVTKSVPAESIVVGNPAAILRK